MLLVNAITGLSASLRGARKALPGFMDDVNSAGTLSSIGWLYERARSGWC